MSEPVGNKSANRGRAHRDPAAPSPWIERFAGAVAPGRAVLDVAAGGGRHSRLFLRRGHAVTAIDIDIGGLGDLAGEPGAEIVEADLEDGGARALAGRRFAAVVVTDYLHRPLFPDLLACIEPGGLLLYETFAVGNEAFGRPRDPAFLLRPGELLDAVAGRLRVLAYEDLIEARPRPAARQRICARSEAESGGRARVAARSR